MESVHVHKTQVTNQETLFDRVAWFYAICRERFLRDDTEQIIQTLTTQGLRLNNSFVVELGCGPGFYATRIAQRLRLLNVLGIDASRRLVAHSKARARLMNLSNSSFQVADVRSLPLADESVDAIITSRLFMILERKEDATEEIFRVLRPGGFFFIAEPLGPIRAKIPLAIMRSLGWLMSLTGKAKTSDDDNNVQVQVLTPSAFSNLIHLQPWERVVQWQSNYYQYAVCSRKRLVSEVEMSGPSQRSPTPSNWHIDFEV
jgi:arsenite methyltransferase